MGRQKDRRANRLADGLANGDGGQADGLVDRGGWHGQMLVDGLSDG